MKKHFKKITYFGTTALLIVMPFLFNNINKSDNEINHNESFQPSEEIKNNNITEQIEISWTHSIKAAYFEFTLDEELNYTINGSNPERYKTLHQLVYVGFQDANNPSITWTPETHLIERTTARNSWFQIHGNIIDVLGIENIPDEWFIKDNVKFFIGYKDEWGGNPNAGDWQNELFTTGTGKTIKSVSNPMIGDVENLEPIEETSTENSVKIEFDINEGVLYDQISYKLNDDSEWIELSYMEEGENELSLENIIPIEENTIYFNIRGEFEDEFYFREKEYKFKVDERNPVINNLTSTNITLNSAFIKFDVILGNINNDFSYRIVENGTPEEWINFMAVEGKNSIEVTNLKKDINYTFEVKINETNQTNKIEFKTLNNNWILLTLISFITVFISFIFLNKFVFNKTK